MSAPELPPSTVNELLRARMAHLATAQAAAIAAATRRVKANEFAQEAKLLADPLRIADALARLKAARKREDEALDELGRAFVAAQRFVRERGLDAPA